MRSFTFPNHGLSINFSLEAKQLDVYVKFRQRALFPCAKCGAPDQPIRDIANHDRTWHHLNFFGYPCYIFAE